MYKRVWNELFKRMCTMLKATSASEVWHFHTSASPTLNGDAFVTFGPIEECLPLSQRAGPQVHDVFRSLQTLRRYMPTNPCDHVC